MRLKRKWLVGAFNLRIAGDSFQLILADIPHELGLQTLCAHFPAGVQRPFSFRDPFVPWA